MPNATPNTQAASPEATTEQPHHVYAVLLDPAVGKVRKVRAVNRKRDPKHIIVEVPCAACLA